MNIRLVGVAAAIGLTAPLMGLFLPPLYEVRDQRHGRPYDHGFRQTALIGAGMAIVVGALISAGTRTPTAFLATVIAVAIIYGVYEWALRNPVGGE